MLVGHLCAPDGEIDEKAVSTPTQRVAWQVSSLSLSVALLSLAHLVAISHSNFTSHSTPHSPHCIASTIALEPPSTHPAQAIKNRKKNTHPLMSSPSPPLSPKDSKRHRKSDLAKPNESWFLILVNAFKSNFEQTLTYKESELYNWIMQAYPYYRHDMHTMQTSVKTTLSSYECFRQNGRSTWTFIPRRALVHLESLKSEEGRAHSDGSDEDRDEVFGEDDENDEEEFSMHDDPTSLTPPKPHTSHPHPYPYQHQDHDEDVSSGSRIRFVDRHIDLMDADSPTLSAEEIQRFKQEHSAQAKKLKRKASGGHANRPRTRSPPAGLDECSMSMEAWCNLLVQMFEASPKQKTIREIYAWVHDNYPVYRNAPGDAWQADLTAALESNPLFRAMGRGRWQMATQPVQPVVIVNGSIPGSTSPHPGIKEEDEATDSPSVTEDEDWKAIGSKRLLNYSFRRYSIATDTFPKSHYKVGSTMSATSLHPSSTTAIATASGNSPLTATTSGGKLLPVDPRGMGYSTGRRFSSYHQPTPKNSPPLSASTSGLPNVDDFGLQLKNALSEETDEEDPGRRYMAPLQSAITTAVLALQSQSQSTPSSKTSSSLSPRQDQDAYVYPHEASPSIKVEEAHHPASHYFNQPQLHPPLVKTAPAFSTQSSYLSTAPVTIAPVSLPEEAHPPGDSSRPEPAIVIPNGETLATDQMDAIQALALLCGGGV